MDFERLIRSKSDANHLEGAEEAIRRGRKAWCQWKIFQEMEDRSSGNASNFDIRAVKGRERRLVDDFKAEFRQDPLDELERLIMEKSEVARR